MITLIYKKGLLVDVAKLPEGAGQLNNLAAVDSNLISEGLAYVHLLWAPAMDLVVCLSFLYYMMGLSSLGGIVVMALSLPAGTMASKISSRLQKEIMKIRDERMEVMQEVLSGIRLIKVNKISSRHTAILASSRLMHNEYTASSYSWLITPSEPFHRKHLTLYFDLCFVFIFLFTKSSLNMRF